MFLARGEGGGPGWILDGGDDAGQSFAMVTFVNLDVSGNPTSESAVVTEGVGPIPRFGDPVNVQFRIPANYFPGVRFTIRVDFDNRVAEGFPPPDVVAGEANNVEEGVCNVSFGLAIKRQAAMRVPQRDTVPAPIDHSEDIRSSNAAVLRRR